MAERRRQDGVAAAGTFSSAATGRRRSSGASTPGEEAQPTKEYFLGLADMYLADERFAANYGGRAGAESCVTW